MRHRGKGEITKGTRRSGGHRLDTPQSTATRLYFTGNSRVTLDATAMTESCSQNAMYSAKYHGDFVNVAFSDHLHRILTGVRTMRREKRRKTGV